MQTVFQGDFDVVSLGAGETLRVEAGTFGAATVMRLGANPGDNGTLQSWMVLGTSAIGPYAVPTRFHVYCTAGQISYEVSTVNAVGVTVPTAGAAPVDAVAATNTLTSNNTDVSEDDTVTINGTVYTFKTALTPLEGEVLIDGTADGSLTNLVSAINHEGTPDTDYSCAAAHPTVEAAAVDVSHATELTARVAGVAGNSLTLAESAATLSVAGALFEDGVDGTPGRVGDIVIVSAQPYICTTDATVATAGAWKKLSTAAL